MSYIRVMPLILVLSLLAGCNRDTGPASSSIESGPPTAEPSPPDEPLVPERDPDSEEDPEVTLAKRAATDFLAATRAGDRDALTTLADVPFLFNGDVVTQMEQLRTRFARMLDKEELLPGLTVEIRDVVAFETIAKEEMQGAVGEFLKRNLADGDQIVTADILLSEEKRDRHAYYVRIRGGKAKVAGWLDVPIR